MWNYIVEIEINEKFPDTVWEFGDDSANLHARIIMCLPAEGTIPIKVNSCRSSIVSGLYGCPHLPHQRPLIAMKRFSFPVAFFLSGMLLVSPAAALEMDDTLMLDPRSCQVEAGVNFHHYGTDFGITPVCNVADNLELRADGEWNSVGNGKHARDWFVQGKTVLRPVMPNRYGIALMASGNRHTMEDVHRMSYRLKMPVTFSYWDDAVLFHINAGLLHDVGSEGKRLTWGLGNEVTLSQRLSFMSEVMGTDQSNYLWGVGSDFVMHDRLTLSAEVTGKDMHSAEFSAGFTASLVPDRLELDVSYGNRVEWRREYDGVMLLLRWMIP